MQIEFIDHVNDENADLHSMPRDGLYGDGFFTTGLIDSGEYQHWDYHLERMLFSASRLCYTDFSLEIFRASIEKRVANIDQAAFRISITRCQKTRGYRISNNALILCRLHLFPIKQQQTNCELIFATTPISVNPYFAGIKHLNRLDNVLAANEIEKDNQEALMFNDDIVISGSKSNLFVFKQGEWHTPVIDKAGVNGITRLRILKMMEEEEIVCRKSHISRGDLDNVEAAFVSNSLIGIWPAQSIQGKMLGIEPSQTIKKLLNDKY